MADEQQFQTNDQQVQAFITACDAVGQDVENLTTMVEEVTTCLQNSHLSSISIRGSAHFRFTDDLIHTLTEALITSKISLKSLYLPNHRITDVGVIQLCQLILVSEINSLGSNVA